MNTRYSKVTKIRYKLATKWAYLLRVISSTQGDNVFLGCTWMYVSEYKNSWLESYPIRAHYHKLTSNARFTAPGAISSRRVSTCLTQVMKAFLETIPVNLFLKTRWTIAMQDLLSQKVMSQLETFHQRQLFLQLLKKRCKFLPFLFCNTRRYFFNARK